MASAIPTFAQTKIGDFTGMNGPTFVTLDTRAGVTWLYVSEHGNVDGTGGGRILRYNLTTGATSPQVVAAAGSADGQFRSPDAMLFDASGNVFIADRFLNRITKLAVDASTGASTFLMKWGQDVVGAPDEMTGPIGLAFDSAGAIYVSEHGDAATGTRGGRVVAKYTLNGNLPPVRVWRLANGLGTAYGLVITGSTLYVSDGYQERLQIWDLNGNPGTPIGVGTGVIPLGLSIDSSGALWIAQTSGNGGGPIQRIERRTAPYTTAGTTFGTPGSGPGQFSLPFHAVASPATNRLYVTNYGNNRVDIFDTTPGAGDTTRPTVNVTVASSNASASTVTFNVNFSESVTGVSNTVFAATGGGSVTTSALTAGSVVGSGANYTVTVGYSGASGSVSLALNASAQTSVRDTSNNFYNGTATAGGSTTASQTIAGSAPTIGAQTATGTRNIAMNYQVVATGATSFSTTSTMPAGLTLSTAGVISGTPTVAATTNINVTATNANGGNSAVVTVTIAAGGTAPTIAAQTANGTRDAAMNYQVVASGATSFSTTSTMPAGLTLSTAGVISGTPTVATSSNVNVTATNANGSNSAAVTINITAPSAAPVIISSTTSSTTAGSYSYSIIASNSPTSYGAANLPSGLAINTASGTISGSVAAGSYTIGLSATNGTGIGSANLALTVTASSAPPPPVFVPPPPPPPPPPSAPAAPVKQSQTIAFSAPVSAIEVNQAVTLGATASSGLSVSYQVLSGNATVSGNVLTIRDTKPVGVLAVQSGNDTYNATSAQATFNAIKASQSITFAAVSSVPANAGSINLGASATSGLPVTYTLVSGPGSISGSTLALTGVSGTVMVRASQSGNDSYNAAADVTRSFAVAPVGQQVFFGTMGNDAFGAVVDKDNVFGTLVARLAATGEAVILKFAVQADGSFSAKARSVLPAVIRAQDTPATAGAGAERTFNGTLRNGVLSGSVAELGTSFSANVQSSAGSTASVAGIYQAGVPGSASGDTYIVVGSNGQAFALTVTPAGVLSGSGSVTADGRINISTAANGTIVGAIDTSTGTITGTVTAAGVASNFAGIGAGTARTDRLVNLSSRVRVTAGDGSRAVIAGFVITGSSDKQILVRAVGPGLTGFGITDALAAPRLQLFDGASRVIGENAGWNGASDVSVTGDRVGAFKLLAGSRDAAIVATVRPGNYTAQVTSTGGNGVVLIEVYDAATGAQLSTQQLVNISTRGFVETGEGQLVAGFVVIGNAPKKVLIRGIGPGLTAFGVPGAVVDPMLKVYAAGNATPIAQNDNWETAQSLSATQMAATSADIAAANAATGAFALAAGSKDAAVVITLMPGNYSAVVSGASSGTGAGLVEVYQISDL